MHKLSIGEQKLTDFFRSQKTIQFNKDETILAPDEEADGVYFVEQGFVKVYWLTESGYEKLHVMYKPTEIFPLMWAVNDEPVRGYYEAMSQVVCYRATKKDFTDFILANPEAMFAVTAKLAQNFEVYVNIVDNLVISKSYPRLIARLLFLAKRFGRQVGGAVVLDVPLTHKHIADSIALTRETVSRGMNTLEEKKLIGKKDQRIVIHDIDKLEAELLDNYEANPLT